MIADDLPAAMVEAAARALATSDWDDPPVPSVAVDAWHESFRLRARAALAAALSVCEAREDWGYVEHWSEYAGPRGPGSPEDMEQWTGSELTARRVVGGSNVHKVRRSLTRRWVFTTPAEPVPDGETT